MLQVNNLVAGYNGQACARLDELSVREGRPAVLTGVSGSGKTTLLLAIAGLAEQISGQIVIAGEDVGSLRPRVRDRHRGRYIGLIFQNQNLIPGLSALDNMMIAPFAAGVGSDRHRAQNLLDRLGIGTLAAARAETLSGGEAQRLAIARAILLDPRLILADEPTASLDDDACDKVLELLIEATQDSGAALVIATHDARVRKKFSSSAAAKAIP